MKKWEAIKQYAIRKKDKCTFKGSFYSSRANSIRSRLVWYWLSMSGCWWPQATVSDYKMRSVLHRGHSTKLTLVKVRLIDSCFYDTTSHFLDVELEEFANIDAAIWSVFLLVELGDDDQPHVGIKQLYSHVWLFLLLLLINSEFWSW